MRNIRDEANRNEVVIMDKDPFNEYLKESEPDKASKGYEMHLFERIIQTCKRIYMKRQSILRYS